MRSIYARSLIFVLAALTILQSGAGRLELCLCAVGGIEVRAAEGQDCCSGEGEASFPSGVSVPHGSPCTDCIDIPIPGDGREISMPYSVSVPDRVPVALPIGLLHPAPTELSSRPVSLAPIQRSLALYLSRTVILRR